MSEEVHTQNALRIAHGSSLTFRKAQGTGGIESAFGLTCVTYTEVGITVCKSTGYKKQKIGLYASFSIDANKVHLLMYDTD